MLRAMSLFLVLAFNVSAGLVEYMVEFDAHHETRSFYISGENLEHQFTSNCTSSHCGFNFRTPQPDQTVTVEFDNDYDPHHSYYWQNLTTPFVWNYITSGPYLDTPVTFTPSQQFSIVASSSMAFHDTAADPGFFRLYQMEYPNTDRPLGSPSETPEPATFALMGGGIFAIAIWRRRRQHFL